MGNMFFSSEDTVQNFSRFQIHDVKADMISEAHISDAVTAIHGVGEYSAFTHVLDLADHFFIVRIKYRQHRLAAKVQKTPVQADETVVRRRTHNHTFDHFAIVAVEHQHSAIGSQVPISSGNVDLFAIQSNG